MKLLNIIKEDGEELDDETRNKIINRGHSIYKLLKKGSFSIGEDTKWSKKRTFKYVLSGKYSSEVGWDFISDESYDLKPSSILCVENIYILFPYMSPGFRSDMTLSVVDRLYEIFKKYDVHLHVGKYGKCMRVNSERSSQISPDIKIINDENDWENLFKNQ